MESFTSTSARTAVSGSAPRSSAARTGARDEGGEPLPGEGNCRGLVLELEGNHGPANCIPAPTFKKAADQFSAEYEAITEGERNPDGFKATSGCCACTLSHSSERWSLLRNHRRQSAGIPSSSAELAIEKTRQATVTDRTLHHETVTLRQVLKTAMRHGWLNAMPDLSQPYKTRAKSLIARGSRPRNTSTLQGNRATGQEPLNNRHRWACEQLHDYVLFMANTGLRPDEAAGSNFATLRSSRTTGTKRNHSGDRGARKARRRLVQEHDGRRLPFQRLQASAPEDARR